MISDYDIKRKYILPKDTKYWVYNYAKVKHDALSETFHNPYYIFLTITVVALIIVLIILRQKIKNKYLIPSLLLIITSMLSATWLFYNNNYHKIDQHNVVSKYYATHQSMLNGNFTVTYATSNAIPNHQPIVANKKTYEIDAVNNNMYRYMWSSTAPNKYYNLKEFNSIPHTINVYFEPGEVDLSADDQEANIVKKYENAVAEEFAPNKRQDIYADKPDYTPYLVNGRHKLCASERTMQKYYNTYMIDHYKFACINYRN